MEKIYQNYEWPIDIPSNPSQTYKYKGWIGISDWLGHGKITNFDKVFINLIEARKFVHELNLINQNEWEEYCKSGSKPNDIPSAPHLVYKNKGWKGLPDFLGKENNKK